MNKLENIHYHISFTDGVITFKNINTTLGFVRYNEEAEVEYIFVNQIFRRKGLAKKLLQLIKEKTKIKPKPQDPISSLGEKLFKTVKKRLIKVLGHRVTERP